MHVSMFIIQHQKCEFTQAAHDISPALVFTLLL